MPTGFSYLSTVACPSGYSAVESGYIKLGSSPNTTPVSAESKSIAHTHSADGDLRAAIGFRTDTTVYIQWQQMGETFLSNKRLPGSASGDGSSDSTYATDVFGDTGGMSANSSINGDDVEPTHIVMRLCVKD